MAAYEIRIKGHLSGKILEQFVDLAVTPLPTGETLLTGAVPDQAALHGLLRRIHDLGLTLVQVQPADLPRRMESE